MLFNTISKQIEQESWDWFQIEAISLRSWMQPLAIDGLILKLYLNLKIDL